MVAAMKQSRRFILEQARALAELGYSEADIARTLRWVEKHLPQDADERTWVPTESDLAEPLDDAAVEDARQAWIKARSIPRKYNSLLDAVSD
jgi:hypothetical protein